MDNTEFNKLASQTIQKISDGIESSDKDYSLDTDLISGILSIEMPNGGQYIINKHDASKQIWVSSPMSGASHFSYNEGKWIDSKNNELLDIIKTEIKQATKIDIIY